MFRKIFSLKKRKPDPELQNKFEIWKAKNLIVKELDKTWPALLPELQKVKSRYRPPCADHEAIFEKEDGTRVLVMHLYNWNERNYTKLYNWCDIRGLDIKCYPPGFSWWHGKCWLIEITLIDPNEFVSFVTSNILCPGWID